jgi:hypothetical protein
MVITSLVNELDRAMQIFKPLRPAVRAIWNNAGLLVDGVAKATP